MPGPDPLQQGQMLSHYRLVEKIGEGGMGVVWKADDTVLHRSVAIKVLPVDLTLDDARREALVKEARTVASVNHAHVVQVHEFGHEGDLDFIVMEYVEGEPLNSIIGGRRMAPEQIAELGHQIARGLARAHREGLIHRDLKPGNILVTPEGEAKIVDFGLATLFDPRDATSAAITRTAIGSGSEAPAIAGTLPYMSPEQLRGEKLDARSDLFSLGCVLYEMTTGQRPFQGSTTAEVARKITQCDRIAVQNLVPTVPLDLRRIIDKALARGPADRYQHADEVAVDLKRLSKDLDTGAAPSFEDLGRVATPRRLPPVRAVVAIMSIVSIALIAWLVRPRDSETGGPARVASELPRATRDGVISIAVLPFDDENPQSDTEYLSAGISESLIGQLSRLSGFRVLSRTTAFRYRGTDPQTAGRELRVAAVLAGRIATHEDNLVIRAELFDVDSGVQLWGNRYVSDRLTDVLAIEEEISRSIASELEVRLTPEDDATLAKRHTANDEALELYLRGRYLWQKRTFEDVRKSLELFERAAEVDSNFALAYTGIADALTVGWSGYIRRPISEAYPEARRRLERALALDPMLAEAQTSLAMILFEYDWDWEGAETAFRRAIELDPNYVTARQWYGEYLYCVGRFRESEEQIRAALDRDPFSPILNSVLAWSFLMGRDFQRAEQQARRALELEPDLLDALDALVDILCATDAPAESMRPVLRRYFETFERSPEFVADALAHFDKGGMRELGRYVYNTLPEQGDEGLKSALWARDVELALSVSETLASMRHPILTYTKSYFIFDPLRSEPRFQVLYEKMRFPDAAP